MQYMSDSSNAVTTYVTHVLHGTAVKVTSSTLWSLIH